MAEYPLSSEHAMQALGGTTAKACTQKMDIAGQALASLGLKGD
ncbi:MAG: hypothetical protein PHN64_08355 [Desulfovibrionaceae bacterium]|nr:hypothetical protein [Desulfovibrionaceae bacterium]